MDDATRAELAQLRRRAFGPDPDIAGDQVAMDRLVALEALVLSEHAAAFAALHTVAVPAGGPGEPPARLPEDDEEFGGATYSNHIAALPQEDEGMPQPPPTEETPADRIPGHWGRRRDGSGIALAAAVTAVLIGGVNAVGPSAPSSPAMTQETTREAYSFARDADADILMQIPVDGGLRPGAESSPTDGIPPFPSSGTVEWAVPLGEYYGWDLWIGGAKGFRNEQCIAVVRGAEAKGRCVVAALRAQSALVVSLPYTVIEPSERPEGLVPGKRIGFWWTGDPLVRVLLGAVPSDR